jgi:hypothetical protein
MEEAYLTLDVLWQKYSLLGFVMLVLERLVHILCGTFSVVDPNIKQASHCKKRGMIWKKQEGGFCGLIAH